MTSTAPGRVTTHAGLLMWAAQPLYVVIELAVAAAAIAPYDLARNTISDLGAVTCTSIDYPFGPVPVCSPWHALLNASFVVFGVLLAVGAVLLRPLLPRGPAATVSTVLWVIAGLGSAATGLAPLDQGVVAHLVVSTPVFLAQPPALIMLGVALRRERPAVGRWTVAVGVLTLVTTAAYLLVAGSPDVGGLVERLALWPVFLWQAVVAVALWRTPAPVTNRPRPPQARRPRH